MPLALHELALRVLGPILYSLIHIGRRYVLLFPCNVLKNVLFLLLGHKGLDAMEHPVVIGHVVAVNSPLLFLGANIVRKGTIINLGVGCVEPL